MHFMFTASKYDLNALSNVRYLTAEEHEPKQMSKCAAIVLDQARHSGRGLGFHGLMYL